MSKLHEVLAVEPGLKGTADKIVEEAKNTFAKKRGHFEGAYRGYQKILDGTIEHVPQVKPLETTVADKLEYVERHIVKALDCIYQKEDANTLAKADLVVDGTTIAKDLPATFLLNLENRFKEIRKMYNLIPTLDPSHVWTISTTENNVYESNEIETLKTEKVIEPLLLAPATKEHPAQVDKISRDRIVGKWLTRVKSGAITPSGKSRLLGRLDTLVRAIKKARMRANNQTAKKIDIGKKLFDFINA